MTSSLVIGNFTNYGVSNTCLHRLWVLEALTRTERIDSTLPMKSWYKVRHQFFLRGWPMATGMGRELNANILKAVKKQSYRIIWIDKGVHVWASTLRKIRQLSPDSIIVGYSPDDMTQRHNQSQYFLEGLSVYDYFVTTKSHAVESLKKIGARNVLLVDNAYEEKFHYPREVNLANTEKYGGEIGFIGSWEEERCNSILYLAERGLPVRVWGGGRWLEYQDRFPNLQIEEKPLYTEEYCTALSNFKINLCFLRKINYDLQTTRTMEIPACGGFLMAERTREHVRLFEEGTEAAFFEGNEQLFEQCSLYLKNEDLRQKVARGGYERCIRSGYSNEQTIGRILKEILPEKFE